MFILAGSLAQLGRLEAKEETRRLMRATHPLIRTVN